MTISCNDENNAQQVQEDVFVQKEHFNMKRGVNICHWLSQSDDRGDIREKYFTEKDVALLAEKGFDHLRMPIDEEQIFDESGNLIPEAISLLHNSIEWCKSHNLSIIVDLHVIRSHHFNEGERPLWNSIEAQNNLVKLWITLSNELNKYDTQTVAYEILNEPVAPTDLQWNALAARLIKTIRDLEPNRKILVGSNRWQNISTLKDLKLPRNDENLIISFHFYEPHLLTHYRAEWTDLKNLNVQLNYPGDIISDEEYSKLSEADKLLVNPYRKEFNKDVFTQIIDEAVEVAKEYGYQLHCGEFGCYNKTPYSIKIAWTKDITDILVEKGIAYSYWGHKGGFGFINNNGQVSDVTLLNILTGN